MGVCVKDTVPTDKEDDKVDGNQNARKVRPSIGHNAIIHDVSPLLPCQDLRDAQVLESMSILKGWHGMSLLEIHISHIMDHQPLAGRVENQSRWCLKFPIYENMLSLTWKTLMRA